MIKSIEEFNKIIEENNFGSDGKIDQSKATKFLFYLKEGDRLEKLIKSWNSEQNKLKDGPEILEARTFSYKLRSVRRLYLNEFKEIKEDDISKVDTEIIKKKITELIDNSLKIKRGDTFRCIKDVLSRNNTLRYKKGKVYISDIDGCITNERGETKEYWPTYQLEFSLHFEVCKNSNLKPNELIEIKAGDKFRCVKDYKKYGIKFSKNNIYECRPPIKKDGYWEIRLLNGILLSEFQEHFIKI